MNGLSSSDSDWCRALEVAEASKSRSINELLGRDDLMTPPSIPAEEDNRERILLTKLTEIDSKALAAIGTDANSSTTQKRLEELSIRRELLKELHQIWEKMAQYDEDARDYVALRRGDQLKWKDYPEALGQVASGVALLSFFVGKAGTYLFVVRSNQDFPQFFPLTEIGQSELTNALDDFRQDVHGYAQLLVNGEKPQHKWRNLGKSLIGPALTALAGVNHVILSPHGLLHYLPLHALFVDVQQNTLLDHVSLSYASSFGILARLLARSPSQSSNALVLGYSPGSDSQFLQDVLLGEAEAVADLLHVDAKMAASATSELITQQSSRSLKIVHLSCHGSIDADHPLDSKIQLADGPLTARSWLRMRTRASLVTLSACDIGISESLGGDEMAGFAQALLLAGGDAALLGSWAVSAYTTAGIMAAFYQRLLRDKVSKATALRAAMLAMRDGKLLPPNGDFDPSQPYFWAGFNLYGDWRQLDSTSQSLNR